MTTCPVCNAPLDCPPSEAEGCCGSECFRRLHGFDPRDLGTLHAADQPVVVGPTADDSAVPL